MSYHFTNLVFEGGGVKGIAYVGAMEEIERRGILSGIQRVAGTSAGAINAILVGLGYTTEETKQVLWDMDFNKFMDASGGFIGNSIRLIRSFGWFKGDFCRDWIGELVKAKTGDANCTFAAAEEMKKARGFKSMYFMTTNISTRFSEVFSAEKTPDVPLADAVRFSMSIPFFFAAKRYGSRQDVYVDGGVLDNYPVKIFDRMRYVTAANRARSTKYYDAINREFLEKHPQSSPYAYNKETLGFRLDSKDEISLFRDQNEPVAQEVSGLFGFIKNIAFTYLDAQDNAHLHSDDWQRTIYIDTLGVGTTDFKITDAKKEALLISGRNGTQAYFDWYDGSPDAANK
jgi:NTE family protein